MAKLNNGHEDYPFLLYQTQLSKILIEGAKNE